MRTLLALALTISLVATADAGNRLKKPRRGFQMRVDDFTVQPGEDLEMCEYRRLPNKKRDRRERLRAPHAAAARITS